MTSHTRVAIVGAGFAGLGMAIRLEQEGIDDFCVLERADDVGGTWRDNTYPGATCDVPSQLYSFSFAPNPDWSHSFSAQPQIQSYLRDCAGRFGVRARIRFGHDLQDARWDDGEQRWHLETSRGRRTADILVGGMGALSEPSIPPVPGIETFTGTIFHSAGWDHDHDLTGERVAVVGSGASAIQFVPEIAPVVGHLDVYQRTPPWIIPRWDRTLTRAERRLYRRLPALQRLVRAAIYWGRETYVVGFRRGGRGMWPAEHLARRHLGRQIRDPALREQLTPDYTIGCKRILISNDYYPTLERPGVDLVASAVSEIRPRSVVDADGVERPADTIIFGTGFHVTDLPAARLVRGRGGRLLADVWRDGMEAHLGTTVHGFPNLFLLTGPNTGLGHTSMVFMIESQLAYVLDCLREMRRSGAASVEVRAEAQAAYNAALQERLRSTVWNAGGCASWYLDERGRNTTLWPDFTWRFRRRTRRFDTHNYALRTGPHQVTDRRRAAPRRTRTRAPAARGAR